MSLNCYVSYHKQKHCTQPVVLVTIVIEGYEDDNDQHRDRNAVEKVPGKGSQPVARGAHPANNLQMLGLRIGYVQYM